MKFITVTSIIVLIITFFTFYSVKNKFKHWVILFASVFFVASVSYNALYFGLFFAILNYTGGILLYKYLSKKNIKRIIFWVLIIINIGSLIFFKYVNFIIENINSLFGIVQITSKIDLLKLILPAGISYYTFQSIGYQIKISRGVETPDKNFITFSSFLLFFPKFLAGPIERSNHFLIQVKNLKRFNQTNVSEGLKLILFGTFKKIVIADNLYYPISRIYSNVHNYSGSPLIFVLMIQLIYVYCDFSGYTDIAIGLAKLFGINIIDNFNRPFMARSITEFWKRWHISLSSWCNDFIFLPFIIKYRKYGILAAILGTLITFLIIGIWHGANWTFIILGLIQAIAIIYEYFTKKIRLLLASKLPDQLVKVISRMIVFFYMSISMVFFFSNSISDAWYFITHLYLNVNLKFSGYNLLSNRNVFLITVIFFILLEVIELMNENGMEVKFYFSNMPKWFRWSIYYLLIAFIYFQSTKTSSFVYMNF